MSDADLANERSDAAPDDGVAAGADARGDQAGDAESLALELEKANERVLRAQAELENYRKRARRDAEDARRYANLPLLADLLPVLDNLERAWQAATQHENAPGLLEGVQMVSEQLLGVLTKYDCERIEAEGAVFDPNLHEAIGQEPTSEHPQGTITRVTRVGYRLHDRIIRPPQVLIAVPPPDSSSAATPGDPAATE